MKGMLAPKFQEVVIGHAEVRMTYKVSAVGTIAGCMVKDGKVTRDAKVRVLRDNIVIHEGEVGSSKRATFLSASPWSKSNCNGIPQP